MPTAAISVASFGADLSRRYASLSAAMLTPAPNAMHTTIAISNGPMLAALNWPTPITDYGFRRVIYDPQEKIYKAWARITFMSRTEPGKRLIAAAYAESREGLEWVQPELDVNVIEGQRTNLVLYDPKRDIDLVNVRLDQEATAPSRRYVAMVRARLPEHPRAVRTIGGDPTVGAGWVPVPTTLHSMPLRVAE